MKNKIILISVMFILMIIVPLLALESNSKSITKQFVKIHTNNCSPDCKSELNKETSSLAQENLTKNNKTFKILDDSSSQILEVDDLEFMYGAVVTEMPPAFCEEALKAQAVATYTYFCKQRESERNNPTPELNGADFSANTKEFKTYTTKEFLKERWKEQFDFYYQKETACINSVFKQVLKSDNELALTMYHAISGGNTEYCKDVFGGGKNYLVPVVSPGDLFAPSYKTYKDIDLEEFKNLVQNKWNDIILEGDPTTWITQIEKTNSGTVKHIKIGSISTSGQEIRNIFSLRSANFEVAFSENKFHFIVYGYGHAVGMSQYGAEYMAKQGADYKQILNWYYPNTNICIIE